jgi:hypothetical protein
MQGCFNQLRLIYYVTDRGYIGAVNYSQSLFTQYLGTCHTTQLEFIVFWSYFVKNIFRVNTPLGILEIMVT